MRDLFDPEAVFLDDPALLLKLAEEKLADRLGELNEQFDVIVSSLGDPYYSAPFLGEYFSEP